MNESKQDSEVTFGGVTMEQSEVIPDAGKTEKKQVLTQSANGTEDKEEMEPIQDRCGPTERTMSCMAV